MQPARQTWREPAVQADVSRWVVYDESSAKTNMTRLYGRRFDGRRLVDACPHGHWATTTVLGALRPDGTTVAMPLEGPVDTLAFEAYVEKVLLPTLTSGDVFVLDDLQVHKSAQVARRWQDAGVKLCFLPPYSPDYNPIEAMWSKVKALLRKFKARTQETLHEAIRQALAAVTPQDAAGWFHHCGYQYTHT